MVATYGLPFWVGIVVGLVGAVVLALLLGVPTLRLRADYLAIVTIAAAEIVRLIARSVTFADIFGGSDGRQGFAEGFYDLNPYSRRAPTTSARSASTSARCGSSPSAGFWWPCPA